MWINISDDEARTILQRCEGDHVAARVQHYIDIASDPDAAKYHEAASMRYARDGELEIDEDCIVSKGDDPGAYVMMWRWVCADEAGVETDDDEDSFDSHHPDCPATIGLDCKCDGTVLCTDDEEDEDEEDEQFRETVARLRKKAGMEAQS